MTRTRRSAAANLFPSPILKYRITDDAVLPTEVRVQGEAVWVSNAERLHDELARRRLIGLKLP